MLHVGAAQYTDERAFAVFRRERFPDEALPLPQFKAMLREQFFLLRLDESAALAALPDLLPQDEDERKILLEIIREMTRRKGPVPRQPRLTQSRGGSVSRLIVEERTPRVSVISRWGDAARRFALGR